MAYMRIHCNNCGGSWILYGRDNWNDDRARQCPHCYSEIDPDVWAREVLPAFGAAADANAELYKQATGYHEPMFTVDFIAEPIYQSGNSKADKCPFADAITGAITELEELINVL